MRLWIKASLITFAIALVILVMQSLWFLGRKDKVNITHNSVDVYNSSSEPQSIRLLKDSLLISTFPENYSNFALRLSNIYFTIESYDSAARYKELIAIRFPNEENWESAGLMYFKAFESASGEEQEQNMAIKAITCLKKGLRLTSSVKVKLSLAKLYLAYDKPKQAIDLLHEVLTKDAANKEALYMMGIHMFQLNQFEEASEYLSYLVQVDSSNTNGLYFLAVSHVKLGNTKKAKILFEKLKLLDISEEVKANANDYLNEIK